MNKFKSLNIDRFNSEMSVNENLFQHFVLRSSNNHSFHLKHPGVSDSSDGSDRISYSVTENYTLSVTESTGHVAYIPPILCTQIRTIRTTCVLHSSQGLQLCCSLLHNTWRCLCVIPAACNILPICYCFISDATLSPYMFSFEIVSLITIQSAFRLHRLPLHLLRPYRILQV
jgi:hypothetical protein